MLLAVVVELEAEVVEEKEALEDWERSGRRLRLEREVGREKPSSMSTSGGMTKEDTEDWLARRRTVPVILGVERVGVLLLEERKEEEGGSRMVVCPALRVSVLSSSSSSSISSKPSLSASLLRIPHPPIVPPLPDWTPSLKEPAPTLPPKSSTPQSSSSSSSPPRTPADE